MRTFPEDQIEELRAFCASLATSEEAGLTYILLQQLNMPDGCSPATIDALLCPMPRDGYLSRLFFAERVSFPNFPNPNWNANSVRILERNWHAISWKTTRENMRLAQMLADHLKPHP